MTSYDFLAAMSSSQQRPASSKTWAKAARPAEFGDGAFSASPFLVAVRVRPQSPDDAAKGVTEILQLPRPNTLLLEDDPATYVDETREFEFEVVLSGADTQDDVFARAGSPLITRVLAGYNGCALTYGTVCYVDVQLVGMLGRNIRVSFCRRVAERLSRSLVQKAARVSSRAWSRVSSRG